MKDVKKNVMKGVMKGVRKNVMKGVKKNVRKNVRKNVKKNVSKCVRGVRDLLSRFTVTNFFTFYRYALPSRFSYHFSPLDGLRNKPFMKSIRAHKDLDVWQVSMALVKDIYCITKNFPSDERFGLILQLRRAVVSIPSNIAEGASRQSSKETIQFLYIALGSLSELETQVEIARELDFIKEIGPVLGKILRVRAMLVGLVKNVREVR